MPHIHTEPGQHDLTASGYIVRTDGDELQILLHMHKKLGRWLQFGGHVELDEHPWSAVAHEVLEESGYQLNQLTLLQPPTPIPVLPNPSDIIHPLPFYLNTHKFDDTHYHTGIDYIFLTNEPPVNTVAEGESNDLKLFTATDLNELGSEEIFSNIRALALFALEAARSDIWQQIEATDFSY